MYLGCLESSGRWCRNIVVLVVLCVFSLLFWRRLLVIIFNEVSQSHPWLVQRWSSLVYLFSICGRHREWWVSAHLPVVSQA